MPKENWIENMLMLQETDLRMRRLQERLSMLPAETEKLRTELEESKKELHDTKEAAAKAEMEIKKIESEIAGVNQSILKLSAQSANIRKNDEYKAYLQEVENHKRKIGEFETAEIGWLDEIEKRKNAFSEAKKRIEAKERGVQRQLEEWAELKREIEAELEKMKPVRTYQASVVEPDVLSVYERLLTRGKGIPLVPIQNGNCGNCHLKLTPQTINLTRKHEMVYCDNCRHLLYFRPD
jgi:predicted  nucleic acid-binding Zn-ribbon protein